jgi:hypothetical protein
LLFFDPTRIISSPHLHKKLASPQILHGSLIIMAKLEEAQETPSHMKWAFLSVAIL